MLKFICVIMFAIIILNGYGQESRKDSIVNALENYTERDTNRVTLLRDYSIELIQDTIPEQLLTVANEVLSISKELKYPEGIVYGNLILARYYEKIGNHKKTKDQYFYTINNSKAYRSSLRYPIYQNFGHYFYRYNQYDSSFFYYTKAFEIIPTHLVDETFQLLSNITISSFYSSQFDTTIYYSRIALDHIKKNEIKNGARAAANIIASAFKRKGDIDSALHYFNMVVGFAEEEEDKFAEMQVYNNMANIYGDQGDYPKALDYYLLTLKTAEDIDSELGMLVTYNNIAIVYYTLKEYKEALNYLHKSFELSKDNENVENMVNTMNNIGELYFNIDSIDKSYFYYKEAGTLLEEAGEKTYYIYNYKGKGLIFDRKGMHDSAILYLNNALKIAREIDSKLDMATTNVAIAQHYLLTNNLQKSLYHANQGLNYAQEIGLVETIRDAADVLHQANAKLVRHRDAYKYLKVYTEMNDSLLNQDNTREVTQLEMQYKHDKELHEREAQETMRELERQKEITKQKGLRNAFIVAFILVLLIIVIVVRSIRQKQKANQLLAYQKAEIEEKNEELQQLMSEISRQKDEIESSHNLIKGSIRYAERIQNALLPTEENLSELFVDHFVFYKPLEIVSGDFYWVEKVHGNILIAAADCTGHGVPGAMLSMLGISYLNDIARQPNIVVASQVLELMRKRIKRSLHQTGDVREARDGMDLAFAAINIEEQTLDYAGANNPILIFRNGEMIELEPDKQPIGVFQKEEPFKNQLIKLEKDDVIYLFTDGFLDQFNGTTNKKYGSKKFKELLGKIHSQPMLNQKNILRQELDEWMNGTTTQIDDILVAGFRWK